MARHYITKTIYSDRDITSQPEKVWANITNVDIDKFSDPLIFRILDIPKPLKAEIISEGEGGSRIAYFNSGKRFMQKILVWKPMKEYAFSFNAEKGFRVGYFFELSEGIFIIPTGAYFLTSTLSTTNLKLETTYSLDRRLFFLFNLPVRIILKLF